MRDKHIRMELEHDEFVTSVEDDVRNIFASIDRLRGHQLILDGENVPLYVIANCDIKNRAWGEVDMADLSLCDDIFEDIDPFSSGNRMWGAFSEQRQIRQPYILELGKNRRGDVNISMYEYDRIDSGAYKGFYEFKISAKRDGSQAKAKVGANGTALIGRTVDVNFERVLEESGDTDSVAAAFRHLGLEYQGEEDGLVDHIYINVPRLASINSDETYGHLERSIRFMSTLLEKSINLLQESN